jgi:hypothetical protein
MPEKSKLEREIYEILEKTDAYDAIDTGTTEKSRQANKLKALETFSDTTPKRSPNKKRLPRISLKPENLIFAGMLILAFAAFIPAVQVPTALVGVGLFVAGYVLWFRSGASQLGDSGSNAHSTVFFGRNRSPKKSESHTPKVKYWRGRRIEQNPKPPKSPNFKDPGKIIDFRSSKENDDKL